MGLLTFTSFIIPYLIAPLWDLSSQATFLRHSINTVFEVYKNDMSYILRISDAVNHPQRHVEEELALVEFLFHNGLPVACPVRSTRNNLVETITYHGTTYHVTLFTKLTGRHITPADITCALAAKFGTFFGTLHQLSKIYTTLHQEMRYHWHDMPDVINAHHYIPHDDTVMQQEYRNIMSWLSTLPKNDTCYGLVHSDPWDGNFLLDDHDNLLSFDYDDCHYHWFVYDLAVCLSGFSLHALEHPGMFNEQALKDTMLAAYHQKNPLDSWWYEQVDNFIRLRNLYVYSWIYKELFGPTSRELALPAHEEALYKKFVTWWRNVVEQQPFTADPHPHTTQVSSKNKGQEQ